MAAKSGLFTLKDLKRQAEEIGFEGKEKTKFLTQRWKMIQENEVRKLKWAAEAKKKEIGCRSRGKKIGCRGSGTGSGKKTQAGNGKVVIRMRESEWTKECFIGRPTGGIKPSFTEHGCKN